MAMKEAVSDLALYRCMPLHDIHFASNYSIFKLVLDLHLL